MNTHNMFLLRNKKNINTFWLKKAPYLELWVACLTVDAEVPSLLFDHIDLSKSGYQVNIFRISLRKHMLWVLIRSASSELMRRF